MENEPRKSLKSWIIEMVISALIVLVVLALLFAPSVP